MDKPALIYYDVECLLSKESTVEFYQNSYFACGYNSSLNFFPVVWHFTQEMLEGYKQLTTIFVSLLAGFRFKAVVRFFI